MGEKVTQAAMHFFESGCMDSKLNFTHIVLIPKIANPKKVSDYRPISLCNVLYKVISRILVNRLKHLMLLIISGNQSAFIKGRLITDNILIAYESLHAMRHLKSKRGLIAVKFDMSKAYDRLEWDFIRCVLLRMGFASQWVDFIMACVTMASYAVVINGEPKGAITPSRGIRQGDPLLPYLFIICAEALSGLLKKVEIQKAIQGVRVCRRSRGISHLFFADDCLIFCDAFLHDCQNVLNVIQKYE